VILLLSGFVCGDTVNTRPGMLAGGQQRGPGVSTANGAGPGQLMRANRLRRR
jgi:hypothetical protein